MKRFAIACVFLLCFFSSGGAVSLDGRSGVVHKTTSYAFADGDFARGLVFLGGGFSVPAAGSIFLGTNFAVEGPIQLNRSGKIILERDLLMQGDASFASRGTIAAEGAAILLGNDVHMTERNVVHCTGDMVIDGNGHTLYFDDFAQLFVDTHATVTFRNMVIKTGLMAPGSPAIALSDGTSKLAFDNVVLSLGSDFYCNNGHVFFHNDVAVSGVGALVYRSPLPSYVAASSKLIFDLGTTFSYAPATAANDLLYLENASSRLVCNGASLKTTFTGMEISRGALLCDNAVLFDASAGTVWNDIRPVVIENNIASNKVYNTSTQSPVLVARWSPCGRYVALGQANGLLHVEKIVNEVVTPVITPISITSAINTLAWSADGCYLAVGQENGTVRVYVFTGTALSAAITPIVRGAAVTSLAWSPDGTFLVVGSKESSQQVSAYRFTGTALVQVGGFFDAGGDVSSVCWSACEDVIFIACNYAGAGNKVQVLQFDAVTGLSSTAAVASLSVGLLSADVSPDGRVVVVGGDDHVVYCYHFSDPTTPLALCCSTDVGGVAYSLSWNADGSVFSVGCDEQGGQIKSYRYTQNALYAKHIPFNENAGLFLTSFILGTYPVTTSNTVNTVHWDAAGLYMLVGDSLGCLRVFKRTNTPEHDANAVALRSTQGHGATLIGRAVAWSPDGSLLAVGCSQQNNIEQVYLYAYDHQTHTLTLQDAVRYSSTTGVDNGVHALSWSHSGRYFAVGGQSAAAVGGFSNTHTCRVYQVLENHTLSPVASINYGTRIRFLDWSYDDQYLAAVGRGPVTIDSYPADLQVYSFNGSSLAVVASRGMTGLNTTVNAVAWSPDGQYVAMGGGVPVYNAGFPIGNKDAFRMYKFDRQTNTLTALVSKPYVKSSQSETVPAAVYAIAWSKDGHYVAFGGYNEGDFTRGDPAFGNDYLNYSTVRIYTWENEQLAPLAAYSDFGGKPVASSLIWSHDGYHFCSLLNKRPDNSGENALIVRSLDQMNALKKVMPAKPSNNYESWYYGRPHIVQMVGDAPTRASFHPNGRLVAVIFTTGAQLSLYDLYEDNDPGYCDDHAALVLKTDQAHNDGQLDVAVHAGAQVSIRGNVVCN